MEARIFQPREYVCQSHATLKIKNFFDGLRDVKEVYVTPEFVIKLPPSKWRIVLRHTDLYKRYATTIALHQSASCTAFCPRDLKVKLEITHPSLMIRQESSRKDGLSENRARATLSRPIFEETFSYDKTHCSGTVTIKCDFHVDTNLYFHEYNIDKDLKDLSNDLKDFYRAGILTDLDLTVGGENLSVHRAVVKARSPYVARILSENPTLQQIDLTNFGSTQQIRDLITYWYCGDFSEIFRTTGSSTLNFVRNIEQKDLLPFLESTDKTLSTLVTNRSSVIWGIEDIESFKIVKKFDSTAIPNYTCEDLSWKLSFFSAGDAVETGTADHISLYIEDIGEPDSVHPLYLEIYFVCGSDEEYGCKRTISWLHPHGKYSFPNFMSHDQFIDSKMELVGSNELRIGCRIHYGTGSVKNEHEILVDSEGETIQDSFTALFTSLKKLFQSRELSNVTLKASERIFRVHKEILAARSGYFRSLFIERYNTAENPVIQLDEIQPDDLDMILKYMYYAEKIELNLERALRLCPKFHSFEMQHLINLCWDYLRSHLTVDNALDIIELASRFNDASLKGAARETIRTNWDQICDTERWRRFQIEHSLLAAEIVFPNIRRSQ